LPLHFGNFTRKPQVRFLTGLERFLESLAALHELLAVTREANEYLPHSDVRHLLLSLLKL
jgi:hypothetical protein